MADANLLVTFEPAHEGSARREVDALLEKEKPKFLKSDVGGLFLLRVGKPKDVVKKLRNECKKEPKKFEYTFNWVPIDTWVSSSLSSMLKEMEKINKKMKDEESWKMELNKRNYDGKPVDLIMQLTEKIEKRKVDLSNPQKIIRVEIIGKKAGISLLSSDELLNVTVVKK